jgi:LacI family transcriptional regulator
MVTIKDVARVAGVSPATVSRVARGKGKVGEKRRAEVQAIIDEMGYRPNSNARALVSKRSELVGIVTPDLYKPFFGSIAHGAEKFARVHRFQVMMRNSQNDTSIELDAINSFRDHGCENIIVSSKFGNEETFIELAKEIPGLIFINRYIKSLSNRCVWLDNIAGGRASADHLYEQGHRNIAIVSFNNGNKDQTDRIEGAKKSLEEKGISIPDKNIIFSTHHSPYFGLAEFCIDSVQRLLNNDKNITAIIAYNDEIALGVINALFDLGKKVPEDISVIGFDDLNIAENCRPQLTTIRYPIMEMAEYATKLSLQHTAINPVAINDTHLFMPTLVKRKSVLKIS